MKHRIRGCWIHKVWIVTVVCGIDDDFDGTVENVCEPAQSSHAQRREKWDVLTAYQYVGGVPPLHPHEFVGSLQVNPLVAGDVDEDKKTGISIRESHQIEGIVRKISSAVVLDGNIQDGGVIRARGGLRPQTEVGGAYPAVLALRVGCQYERHLARIRRALLSSVLPQPL